MAAPRREIKITYGSYVLGYGQTKRAVDGFVRIGQSSHDDTSVEFGAVIYGATSASDFEVESDALHDAFAIPNQRLLVELVNGSTGATEGTLIDLKPTTTGRTALNITPEVKAPTEDGISARSDVFTVVVTASKPASYDSDHARQDIRYTVTPSSSRRRTLRISGTITATATAGALATYEVSILALRSAYATVLGGTWPAVPFAETKVADKEDHVCRFDTSYKERIANETVGTLDDTDVTDQTLVVSVDEVAAEVGTTSDRPLLQVTAAGFFAIDSDVTTDLSSKWESKILPWIRSSMETLAGGTVYLSLAAPGYDIEENRLNPTVVGVAKGGGNQLFQRTRTTDNVQFGWTFRSPFPRSGSDRESALPDPAYAYPLAKVVTRTVETVTRRLASAGGASSTSGSLSGFGIGQQLRFSQGTTVGGGSGGSVTSGRPQSKGSPAAVGGRGGVYKLSQSSSFEPRFLGLPGDSQIEREDRTDRVTVRIIAAVGGASSGAGGIKPPGRTRGIQQSPPNSTGADVFGGRVTFG